MFVLILLGGKACEIKNIGFLGRQKLLEAPKLLQELYLQVSIYFWDKPKHRLALKATSDLMKTSLSDIITHSSLPCS